MNKKLIIIIVAAVLVFLAVLTTIFIIVFTREGIAVRSGTFSNFSVSNISDNSWRASGNRANGNARADYTFDAAELAAMHVNSANSAGRILLTFIQDDTERTFDITGEFNESIDMSDFEPGRIRMRLEFTTAENVLTLIEWAR